MRTARGFITLAGAVIALAPLGGCGGDKDSDKSTTAPPAATTTTVTAPPAATMSTTSTDGSGTGCVGALC